MARKSIQSNYYLFDASAREVIIPGGIQREQLILITNVTDNKVIYNFSDPELTATEFHISTDIRNVTTTRIVLAYDTTSMSDTDQLQIVVDEYEETVKPSETYMDAVNKQRMSQPQSQIDTDFEYGTQSTKWESLAMINNNPFAYKSETPLVITEINTENGTTTPSRVMAVSCSNPPDAGTAIYVQDSLFPGANGVFIIDSVSTSGQFIGFKYTAKYEWTLGVTDVYEASRTVIYSGIHFTGSDIGDGITLGTTGDGGVTVTTTNAHGLEIGNEIAVAGSAGTNVNGSWNVARVTSPVDFVYYPDAVPSGSVNTGNPTKKLYPRPQGASVHRSFDGGVKFSTNSASKNQQAIRQTKRYFRYQSGKGVAFSTGSILAPALPNIDNITSSGTTVTVVASDAHNVTRGTEIEVRGVNDNVYNGTFTVSNIIDPYRFQYTVASTPTESVAGGEYTITPINGFGTRLEIGMMDQQNGLFFRYASGALSVVRRTSTFQLAGRVSVANGSTLVSSYTAANGQSTKFSKQLKPGDYIVLRGSSYRVDSIISDTQLVIFPDFRGPNDDNEATARNIIATKTVETEWFQSDWNLDRMDGTGKSGYTLDVTKMQMFYMDYSWYGAGFIRWGFRAEDGDVIYAHKVPNNNANTEAYMRSGNLPARYEVNTLPPTITASKTFASGDSILYTNGAPTHFPSTGTLRIRQVSGLGTAVIEYINYTGKTQFIQDIISVANNNIEVASTTGLQPGGQQTITFDTPFSNIVAGKTYFIAEVPSSTTFKITDTQGSNTGITLTTQTGSALSPLSRAFSGAFTGITREQTGATANLTMGIGTSDGTVSSGSGIQVGQRVVADGIYADTSVASISGTNISLSKAVYNANPSSVKFLAMSNGSAQTFTYSATQPIGVELLEATTVPQISHWGSSVIMDGRYDDDRAYIYTVGTRTGRELDSGDTRALLALRVAPSVDNGIISGFGARELVNRMQLILQGAEVSSNGSLFVEIILNPSIEAANDPSFTGIQWRDVGGTSLAQYARLTDIQHTSGQDTNLDGKLVGGEVIFGFYAGDGVASYDLSQVKEISNSILGGGTANMNKIDGANPTGMFPDGPEVLAIQVTNIGGGKGSNRRAADVRISWTEAQA